MAKYRVRETGGILPFVIEKQNRTFWMTTWDYAGYSNTLEEAKKKIEVMKRGVVYEE